MKKRLFLFVALIMALCAILAISVSADEVKIKNIDEKLIENNSNKYKIIFSNFIIENVRFRFVQRKVYNQIISTN